MRSLTGRSRELHGWSARVRKLLYIDYCVSEVLRPTSFKISLHKTFGTKCDSSKSSLKQKKSLTEGLRVLWICSEKQFQMRGGGGARGVNGSRCVCWARGRGGGREGTFCLHVWESVVGAGGWLLFPSAGKQCPRRVFYGSCWTLISFVARLSCAAAALSPQKRARPPRTTRYLRSTTGLRVSPTGKVCNRSINNRSAQKWKESYELGCIKDITNAPCNDFRP